jgi:hypothetical protein
MPSDRYMLDTTEFNAVAKGVIPLPTYTGFRVFATHVQLDELNNDPDDQRRAQLISTFEEIGPEKLPTETALWDISKWDEAKYSADDGLFDRMLTRLIELDGRDRGENQRRDILIAETAIKNGLIFLSGDYKLRTVTTEFGGRAVQPPR